MKKDFDTYRLLLILACACVCSFFIWAHIAEINQHVKGSGKIITSGKVRTIQHLEDAIVREILVKEGSLVDIGDTLFQLSNTRAEAEMNEIRVASDALRIRQTRLQAERDEKKSFVIEDQGLQNRSDIVLAEQNLFESRKAELEEKLDGFNKRMKQKLLKLDDLEATIRNLRKEKEVSVEQLGIKRKLYRSGAISRSQYLEAESVVKSFETRISKVQKEIPIVKTEISEIVNLLQETKQNWRSKVVEEFNTVNIDIDKLHERIMRSKDAVNRTEIQSPIKGTVNKLHVNTVGGVIKSSQALAEIIPLQETLVVEGQIATQDRAKIWIGLPVKVIISAYDYATYGSLNGELTHISADSFIDQQGFSYYQVRVNLEKSKFAEDKPILPGMSVEINILAGKISILRALTKPLDQIGANALREL